MKETLSMILQVLYAEIISGMRGFVRAASLAALLCGAQATASTNFFRAATVDGRDWIVAPDGSRQLFLGIAFHSSQIGKRLCELCVLCGLKKI